MYLELDDIRGFVYPSDYNKGMEYYKAGKVLSQTETRRNGKQEVTSIVQGTLRYQVMFRETSYLHYEVSCNCLRFRDATSCKHLAAAMICYAITPRAETDPAVKNLIDYYLTKAQQKKQPKEAPVRLVPILEYGDRFSGGYPSFSFRIGREKLYVVKHVKNFLQSIKKEETVSYGKNLSFEHRMDQFDEPSQKLISVVRQAFPEFGTLDYYPWQYTAAMTSSGRRYNAVTLMGDAFDQLFDLMQGQPVSTGEGTSVVFEQKDPEVEVGVSREAEMITLSVKTETEYAFFGNMNHLYVLTGDRLLRCSGAFRENVYPLLEMDRDSIQLSERDMPTFCDCVLPRLKEHVSVQDPQELLETYIPDECIPCFYFDVEEGNLFLKLKFRYGETMIANQTSTEDTPQIKRNMVIEQSAAALAEKEFEHISEDYIYPAEKDCYEFLTERLDAFRAMGEVFLTEALQRKRIAPPTVKLGISVSDGMLTLDMDTGEFPTEELENLYQSLLKRKKYHRLPDGRYLTLDGSGIEKLSEIAHMLQLSPRELAKGAPKVPAFRALYLDSVLADGEGIHAVRDRQFRSMIRDFKAPEDSDYSLPENLEQVMRRYQRVGFRWLKTLESCHFGGILADEMGLGKTLQMIAFLSSLDREKTVHPNLVVCPASLILNWGDEFRKFAPEKKIALIYGSNAQRKRLLESEKDADVLVTSYDLLRQDIKDYSEMEFYCCVLDEGQYVKNQATLISKAVKQINCRQRFVMTGTPIENRLSELWNLFDFLMPGYLFTHHAFVERLEKPIIKSGNQDASVQLQKMVQPFLLRRMKKDVLTELPPKMEYTRTVPLTESERKVYLSAVNAARSSLDAQDSKIKILAALTQLRQICCDPGLCFENYEGSTSKLDACIELCTGMVENGHQILLFSQFTSMLDRIRQRLDAIGISNFTLQGSTPKEKRAQLVKEFNNGGASVFLISLKAGGTGLNLTAADIVIHFDPWWNLAAQNQATDRAHRFGQQAKVQVYKLITKGTIEEKILQLQDKKSALMELVSEQSEGDIMTMSREELLDLLQYQP